MSRLVHELSKLEENAMRSIRSMLLTTVAAAALGGLPFQAHAQDRQQQSPSAVESPAPQQKGMQEKGIQEKGTQAERSGRSAAEPDQSGTEARGKSPNRSAQENLNSRKAQPAQGAENQSTEEGSMRKPSASSEPMQPERAKKQRHGKANAAATETERRHTMGAQPAQGAENQNTE